jgi:Ca2+/H+ antiporter
LDHIKGPQTLQFQARDTLKIAACVPERSWDLRASVLVLLGATALIAWVSEILVGSNPTGSKACNFWLCT